MTSVSTSSRRRIVALVLATLAANIMVLSTGPVAGNAKLYAVDPANGAVDYSIFAAAGALVAAVSLGVFGLLRNRLVRRFGSDRRLMIMALGLTPLLGFLLVMANSFGSMLLIWCLIQLPAAAVMVVATAKALESVQSKRMALVSALFGVCGVTALMIGGLLGALTNNNIDLVLGLAFGIATLLLVPLAGNKDVSVLEQANGTRGRLGRKFWVVMAGVFAALAAISVSTDYYLQVSMRILGKTAHDNVGNAFLFSTLASAGYLVVTLLTGIAVRNGSPRKFFIASFGVMAVALAILAVAPTILLAASGAALLGIGAGVNVATQLPMIQGSVGESELLGNQSGVYNVVSVLPGFLVPVVGGVLISASPGSWTSTLAGGIAVLALFAGTMVFVSKA